MARPAFSLYIHIPYCISKCPYCDFNSHVVAEIPESAYVDALVRELEHYGGMDAWRERTVQSVFFGGGTPSTFAPQSIGKLLAWLAATFPINLDCEITLEANPGTVDRGNFAGYRDAGVNRISIGVQSFQPKLLRFLGRAHGVEEARNALKAAREAGFDNFSFDLIYANPGQTIEDLAADLDEALEFQPPHLSAYNLTFEEGTSFHHEYRAGRMTALDEEIEIAMAELIQRKLSAAGLQRYEISNYARRGWHSRHNVNYWRSGDYLGLGAGAHSYRADDDPQALGQRWSNEKTPGRYIAQAIESGGAVVASETIDARKAAGEFLFLGLRMTEGIVVRKFVERFGQAPMEIYPKIRDWLDGDLLEETADHLRLTPRGLLVANSIFVELM